MTVRERIKALQREMLEHPTPGDARRMLMELTSLMGNCQQEVIASEQSYTNVFLGHYKTEGKVNGARLIAQVSDEHSRWAEAKAALKLVEEMIRSLKVVIKSVEEEMRSIR